MSRRAPISYRFRLFLTLFVVAAFAQGLVVFSTITTQNEVLHRLERMALLRKAKAISSVVAQHMARRDIAAIEDALLSISGTEQLFSAEVIDAGGASLAALDTIGTATDASTMAITIPIVTGTSANAPALGTLSLNVAPLGALDTSAELRQSVFFGALSVLLVQIFLAWLVTQRFSKPLLRLQETIHNIHHGRLEKAVADTEQPGEIGDVARALESFRCDAIEVQRMRRSHDRRASIERKGILRALDAAGEGLLFLDENENIVFANDRAFQLAGSLGNLSGLLSQITERDVREGLQKAVSLGQDFAITAELKPCPDEAERLPRAEILLGEPLPVRIRANPILFEDGSVVGMILLITDTTEEVRVASRIQRLADHDALTGLHNRQFLEARIDEALSKSKRDLTLLMLDLDRFKSINDALGHMVGDALLIHVADHLRQLTGRRGVAVRLGGDEFAILVQDTEQPGSATELATEIVRSLRKPQHVGERQLLTGASIGIASIGRGQATAKDALHMADLALYEAKRQGRGRYIVFEAALAEAIARKTEVEDALRGALRDKEITAHFQQQRALPGRKLVGFEALARWTSASLGPVSPGEFVTIAEENGLIGPLTQQMVEYAARAAACWAKAGFTGRVSVNISPILFADDVVELIQDALLATACPAEALEIEITEAVFLDQGDRALHQIARLRAMGITVALDDFGTGYSSLGYLQRFPVDKIKIDRAFVSRMQDSDVTRAIVKAIVEMGHALQMAVIGEGAETKTDVGYLVEAGVDTVQGFVDGKPMNAKAADDLVAEAMSQQVIGLAKRL